MEPFDRISYNIRWWPFRAIEWLNRAASTVGRHPVLSNSEFPWTTTLEDVTEQILSELRDVQNTVNLPNFQDIEVGQRIITDDDKWKTYFLYGYGHRDETNCVRCPATDRALRAIPGLQTAMFSILAPGKQIPPHRGPYNGVLRYHLGLVVPDDGERCSIRVDEEICRWEVGSSLIFDDTFEHAVSNGSDQQRVVLFVDFERPLRFPISLLNRIVLSSIRRSIPVRRAIDNLRRHHEKNSELSA